MLHSFLVHSLEEQGLGSALIVAERVVRGVADGMSGNGADLAGGLLVLVAALRSPLLLAWAHVESLVGAESPVPLLCDLVGYSEVIHLLAHLP